MNSQKTDLSVHKIGGTSMANTAVMLENVLLPAPLKANPYNRVIVVSAYAGVTDKLLEHKKTGKPGVYALFADSEADWSWGNALNKVSDQMILINQDIFGEHSDRRTADDFVRERIEGLRSCLMDLQRVCSYGHFRLDEHLMTVREMLSGLGEAHSAHNTALLLRQRGVNASFVDLTGWRQETCPSLEERIQQALDPIDFSEELPIVTGYAHCKEGLMREYDRGYTEVTFSNVAVQVKAKEAIIHKEFHLSSADPGVVGLDKVKTIGQTNYDVADQLSNMGMEAIHPRAARGLRQSEIPLRVKNTFDPTDPGTAISGSYVSEAPCTEIITGVKSVTALEFFDQNMVGVKGYDAAILDALKRHKVRIISKASNANTITHYLAGSLKSVNRVVSELEKIYPSAQVSTQRIALVSAIGSDLNVGGLTGTAISALANANIDVLGLHQLMRNVDIQLFVREDQYTNAVKVLHEALVEKMDVPKKQEAA